VGILFAFCAGWLTCARGGQTTEEVVDALKAVRDSEEVGDLMAALRHHAGYSLQALGGRLLDSGDSKPASVVDLLARVRAMVQPVDASAPRS
jgi:hypothetical protein